MKLYEIAFLSEEYIAYTFNNMTRQRLSELFPPKYSDFIGHHITYKFGVSANTPLPTGVEIAKIVGYADDRIGIEALVVELNGTTQRPDGNVFHITWSLDRQNGYTPKDSKNLVKQGFESVDPIEIAVKPEILK